MDPLCLVDVKTHTTLRDVHTKPAVEDTISSTMVQNGVEQVVAIELRVVVTRMVAAAERIAFGANGKDAMDGRRAVLTVRAHDVVVQAPATTRAHENADPTCAIVHHEKPIGPAAIILGTVVHVGVFHKEPSIRGVREPGRPRRSGVLRCHHDLDGLNASGAPSGPGIAAIPGPAHPAEPLDMHSIPHVTCLGHATCQLNANGLYTPTLANGAGNIPLGLPVLPADVLNVRANLHLARLTHTRHFGTQSLSTEPPARGTSDGTGTDPTLPADVLHVSLIREGRSRNVRTARVARCSGTLVSQFELHRLHAKGKTGRAGNGSVGGIAPRLCPAKPAKVLNVHTIP